MGLFAAPRGFRLSAGLGGSGAPGVAPPGGPKPRSGPAEDADDLPLAALPVDQAVLARSASPRSMKNAAPTER